MGRLYKTDNFEGKFGFGVQSSEDPEYFGMEITDSDFTPYYIEDTKKNLRFVKKRLNENYQILGVPKQERKYEIDYDEIYKYVGELDDKYLFRNREPKDEGEMGYYTEDKEKYPDGMVADTPEKELASYRLILGLAIYNDLIKDGWCYLEAEK